MLNKKVRDRKRRLPPRRSYTRFHVLGGGGYPYPVLAAYLLSCLVGYPYPDLGYLPPPPPGMDLGLVSGVPPPPPLLTDRHL